jgi:hypothetical protein
MSICEELVLPAVVAASLTNDLFSYEKEYEAAQAAGLPDIVNALWVLMREHNISLEEAETRCRTRIKEEVASYVRIVKEAMSRDDLSRDAKKYIELMQYSVSGNVVWSLQCPRYHKHMHYNERQILRGMHGVARYPTTYELDSQKKRKRLVSEHLATVEPTSILGKRTKTGIRSDISDEGIGQSVSPTDPASSPHGNHKEDHHWDVLDLARGTILPEMGDQVSIFGPSDSPTNYSSLWSSLIVMSALYHQKVFEIW